MEAPLCKLISLVLLALALAGGAAVTLFEAHPAFALPRLLMPEESGT